MYRRTASIAAVLIAAAHAAADVQSPKQFFGHDVCEDYWLTNYTGLTNYWKALASNSDRIRLVSMGKTEFGREQWMAVISQPSNLKHLESHRKNSERFNKGQFASDAEAMVAAKKAKSVVWIDGGLHANEVLGAQQLIETAYQLVSRKDEENERILRDNIILLVHANPDGMDLVSDWYMRRSVPRQRSLANVPELYQKYGGHDNNRDFYMMNMAETRNMNRILYETWFPQIVYNHHQSAPAGTIMFIPPFRNPFNYHVDPIIQTATDVVGLNMHQRLISEGLGGTVMRDGASFSAWWNGGLRTTTYFHNMIGILTETWGSPNPGNVPWLVDRQVPTIDLPKPIDAGSWHLRDSLKYELSANYAILDFASRYRERLLFGVYRAAKNSIERGQKDHWTRYPSKIRELKEEAGKRPELRDARQYVIPSDQPYWTSANRFAEALLRTGVTVKKLEEPAHGYPAGSLLIECDQPYRAHILDMFEPQDYPNDFRYPGGPPIAPYDNAGYTLAYQMGVKFDRLLDPKPFRASVIRSTKTGATGIEGTRFALPASENDSFGIVNRALKLGMSVERTVPGNFIVSGTERQSQELAKLVSYGRTTMVVDRSAATPVKKPRIALWDRYGGSMPSGWTRWLLDEFGFDYEVLFAPDLDAPGLKDKYDVIILPSGANFAPAERESASPLTDDPTIPDALKNRWGTMTATRTANNLKQFVENGGHLVAIGSASLATARAMGLPVMSGLTANGLPLPNTEFFIPGSILRMKLNRGPLAVGYTEDEIDVVFDDSPAFLVAQDAPVSVIGSWDRPKPLRSGWAWGQDKLEGKAAMVDISLGKGQVVLFGPEVNFRGQSHGSFKLLFNALLRSSSGR